MSWNSDRSRADTLPGPLDDLNEPKQFSLNLFWRTFILLALLLAAAVIAWLQLFRVMESEPRITQTAHQIASVVNLSRVALAHSDAIARVSLIKQLADTESIRIIPRNLQDHIQRFDDDQMQRVMFELRLKMGDGATLAKSVNGQSGLWISFDIEKEKFWLQTDLNRLNIMTESGWVIWLLIAILLSLAGAAVIARFINRPLKALSFAASRVKDGDFSAGRLNEDAVTSEIREVNQGFNRMATQLAKIDQDRAIMLAGISHDLRTPLARLRLEIEMSVQDAAARDHMIADLMQLDAIIDKFLDYARPSEQQHLHPLVLNDVLHACILAAQQGDNLSVKFDLPKDFIVMGEEVELIRVIANLVENAIKYGKTTETNITELSIAAREHDDWVLLKFRDNGPGATPETLAQMTKPFFRGDFARTAATGAGLGLAIVEKTVQRMGGSFTVSNSSRGGLAANIRLRSARN